jgi:hypothetical protein
MALNVIACKIDGDLYSFVKKQPLTASEYLRGLLLKEYENSRTTGGKPSVNRCLFDVCTLDMIHEYIDTKLSEV